MENRTDLNQEQLEEVTGGRGGSKTELHPTKYCDVYQIERGDNLTRLAKRFNTTVKRLLELNPTITDKNDITIDYYIYIPKQK